MQTIRIFVMRHCRVLAMLAAGLVAGNVAPVRGADVEQIDVWTSGADGYAVYRIPSLATAADGSLVAVCEGRVRGKSDAGDIDLVSKRSTDGGATWSEQQVVWDDGEHTCGNPCMVLDETTGVVWLLATHNLGADAERDIISGKARGSRTVWVASSRDHGATWSAPREITNAVKAAGWTWYATGPGGGIQVARGPHAGRLVIPCDHNDAAGKRYSHAIYSDDHGSTWRRGAATPDDDVNECEVVELSDGRLLLNMRNYDRTTAARQIALSDDGGASWHDQRHDPALVEPICQASIRRMSWPEGDRPGLVVFANPADPEKRRNLTLRGSYDDGATWAAEFPLYRGSSAYCCLARLPSDEIGCLYEADDYGRIAFARIPTSALAEPP